jgi:phosphomannomutase
VSSQAAPNGDFPTVNFPNPEEPGALNHLLELAQRVEADIAIATDPDGDRLALALPDPQGQWQVLMGDQIGLLLTDYRLQQSQHTDESGGRAFVLNTVVSSRLPARVAAAYGADFEQTLTGFKWLWHRALQRQAAGDRFVFAYEDAIGFSPTPRVHDKDGIATAVEVLRLAQTTQASGQTLYDRLNGLYQRYGLSITRQVSLQLDGADATERMHRQLQTLRQSPPARLAGLPVIRVHDYVAAQSRDRDSGRIEPIALPTTNLVQLDLTGPDGDYYISVRPSGTEPKLKIYLEYLGAPGAGGADPFAESAVQSAQLEALAEALNE